MPDPLEELRPLLDEAIRAGSRAVATSKAVVVRRRAHRGWGSIEP